MKRLIKFSQIKVHDYFKDFNWDSLISFNLEACFKVTMKQDNLKEGSSYSDYMKSNLKEFVPSEGSKLDKDYVAQVDAWWQKF